MHLISGMMKKVYFLALSAFFVIMTTAEVMAAEWFKSFGYGQGAGNGNGAGNGGGADVVGAPLDGGLLALLAAAGVTYFAARRKKKNKA